MATSIAEISSKLRKVLCQGVHDGDVSDMKEERMQVWLHDNGLYSHSQHSEELAHIRVSDCKQVLVELVWGEFVGREPDGTAD
jgi:hypothetical protein